MKFITAGESELRRRNYNLSSLCPLLALPYSTENVEKIYKYIITGSGLDWMWFPVEWDGEYGEFFGLYFINHEFSFGNFSLAEFNELPSVRFCWEEIEPITQKELEAEF